MPPKKKEKETIVKVVPVDQIDLRKYCPRKIFDILFVNEADDYSKETLSKIIEIARNYEDISCLTFITYKEVMDLVQNYENSVLPPGVKMALQSTCEKVKETENNHTLSTALLAQLMKLKLIEVMYQHYIKEVKKMQKRKKLEEDLNILSMECKKSEKDAKGKGKGKGGKGSKQSGSKKGKDKSSGKGSGKDKSSGKSKGKDKSSGKGGGKDKGSGKGGGKAAEEVKVIEDYTTIPIESENDIIFDDDIYNHVWFYVFQGFYDPLLLVELIAVNNMPITSVIKISAVIDEETTTISNETVDDMYLEYWNRLYKLFDGPGRLTQLENTILMSYIPFGDDYTELFQQLLYIVKSISNIKLQHLNYIRHIEIYEVKEIYNRFPLECLNVYDKTLEKVPYELLNVPVLLNGLLKEVCARVDDTRTSNSTETISRHSMASYLKDHKNKCLNPCGIEAFFKHKRKTTTERIIPKKSLHSFFSHEHDEANIILNSYKKHGQLVCDSVIRLLKTLRPLNILDAYNSDLKEILHKHDIDPSTKTNTKDDEEKIMHIFYLIFFSTFGCKEIPPDFEETDLTINLQTYDKQEFAELSQTRVVEGNDEGFKSDIELKLYEATEAEEERDIEVVDPEGVTRVHSRSHKDIESVVSVRTEEDISKPVRNYYEKSAIQYFWKEKLAPDVLLQEIYKAQQEYVYMEQKFSPGTDNLLLQFSDLLDEFGINTKIYEQSLITPVCVRDFCKYISVEKAEWLEKNKPPRYFRKGEELEVCKGVKRINHLQLFQEYSHLLETTIKTENEKEEKQAVDENSVTFEHLLDELKNYPPSSKIIEECKKSDKVKDLLAYDFGTKYFQIKGARTTFHSHDDVKISVDNTRFIDEEPKCTISIDCRGNSLIFHSNNFYLTEDYTYHMNLADGTIISFILFNYEKKKGKRRMCENQDTSESNTEEVNSKSDKDEENEPFVDFVQETKVLAVDKGHFESVVENNAANKEENLNGEIEFEEKNKIFFSLKEATMSNRPIYKVSKNLTHLKKLKSEVEIPLTNIIRRVLHRTIEKKNFGYFTKRYTLPNKKDKYKPKIKSGFDARIALPNGLYISFYPSEMRGAHIEVKQEHVSKNYHSRSIRHEEFRLFSREGYILIKKIDGTIRMLKSNGDIIDFEKFDTDSESVKKWQLKPCHCKNINDYRKKLNRLLRKDNEDGPSAKVSRRGHFRTKKGYIVSPTIANMLENSKVPYLRNTLLKFNGNRICFESGKVTQKRIHHITHEQDFFAQEIYYDRSDGFQSSSDKNGKLQVKFPDGTKISSTMHVSKELVDSYVYVSLNFQYEHPNYATVLYHFNHNLEVLLNDAVFIRDAHHTMYLKIDDDILTTAKKESVVFEKCCPRCAAKYKCNVNIDPFSVRTTDYTETFLHARDTYNKHFYVDFAGNCERNLHYRKGPFNVSNCNHYKRMSYKKMFVVNRDFSGEMFWTDNMVDWKRKVVENDQNGLVKEFDDIENDKIKVVKFRREVYDKYSKRFLNTGLLKEQFCLAKYRKEEDKLLFYTTFRAVRKVTSFEEIKACLAAIMEFFIKFGIGTELLKILTRLLREDEGNPEDNMSSREIKQKVEIPPRCKCVQKKIDMAGKTERWREECSKYRDLIRNNVVGVYFASEFCRIIKNDADKTYKSKTSIQSGQ